MLNYIGQLRIYSLIDLIILLIAVGANPYEFVGVVLLHIGFLAYLELKHAHSYRKKLPKFLWLILICFGLIFYGHLEGFAFVLFSYFYTLKSEKFFAIFSPFVRGLQYLFITAGIIGYNNEFIWIVFVLIFIRNLCGDLRDVVKDKSEGLKTLPVFLGLKFNIKYAHLVLTVLTSYIFFQFTSLSWWIFIIIVIIQIFTYNLTPR